MVAPVYYSAAMVRTLPDDGNRYETVHGELLVTPAPRLLHQRIVRRLLVALDRYLSEHAVGEVLVSPADISWGPDVLVQPDVFVVALDEARSLDWSKIRTLLLVAEVLNPSTTRHDRFTKRRLYQEVGVPSYWIVDPDQKLVEVWTPDAKLPDVQRDSVVWQPEGADVPFDLSLDELFGPT